MLKAVIAGVLCFLCGDVWAVPLAELAGERTAALVAGGALSAGSYGRQAALELVPAHTKLALLLENRVAGLKPNVVSEALRLYKKPAGAQKPVWSERERAALYNQTLALSTLSGIEYFSRRRKRMHTLYEYSYIINNMDEKIRQADPVFAAPPDELTVFARQKDTKFGDNFYTLTYTCGKEMIFIAQENIRPMSLAFVPVVDAGALCSYIALFDADDYILIYAVSIVKTIAVLPGLVSQMNTSINNRVEALLSWFETRAAAAYAL
jgi:hypothetical protein